jgi:predicted deacetylase
MAARYLVRLDDACPTMDHERWAMVEGVLDALNVRPIVAVVPENRDADLVRAPADPGFWDQVRAWEAKGWTIAMHGLHHRQHPVDRRRLILPFHDRSEFGGLNQDAQAALMAQSWAAFAAQDVRPTVWVAPAHAFDRSTLRALKEATPIRIISDGLSIDSFEEEGFAWVPQQLWAPEPRRQGTWTICLHPNGMERSDIDRLGRTLSEPYYRARMAALPDVSPRRRRRSLLDRSYHHWFLIRGRAVRALLPLYHAGKRLRVSMGGR